MIVLARHGHVEAEGRCVGRTDIPLSALGREQASRMVGALANAGFVRLCSSPSRRAVDTLAPLAEQLGMEPDLFPGLDEIDMGEWDGLSFHDIRTRYPDAYAERGRRFENFRAPGGESFNDVAIRALRTLEHLAAGPKPVFIVSHAGLIRAVLCRLTDHPMDDLFRFRPGHTECTVLTSAHGRLELVKTGPMSDAV